jgi:hypothetical protein
LVLHKAARAPSQPSPIEDAAPDLEAISQWSYLVLLVVFAGSLAVGLAVPAECVLRQIVAAPAVLVLIGALFQLTRDDASRRWAAAAQARQQSLSLGVASHMAQRAFDENAGFCERYLAEAHSTMRTLLQEGPTHEVLGHAAALVGLKQQFAAWLTKKQLKDLEPFEAALRHFGSASFLARALTGTNDPARRSKTSCARPSGWIT